jgi:hypothetical protein
MFYPVQRLPDQSPQPPSIQEVSASRALGLGAAARARAISALHRLARQAGGSAFRLIPPYGTAIDFGTGEPAFTLRVHRPVGLDALASLERLESRTPTWMGTSI